MADLQSNIAHFASRNEELLGILRQTDYAEASFKQQQAYVDDLEKEIAQLGKDIFKYEVKTRIEKEMFEKYRDSNVRRFLHKVGGSKSKDKFQSKTEKEEKEYYEALEKERAAKDRKASLEEALREGIPVRDDYQRDNDVHVRAQKELDDMYNMIFAGPTPAYAHEDQSEWTLTQAREHYNGIEQQYRAIWQSCDIFNEARKHIAAAANDMDFARRSSRWDMLGGGMWADMDERSLLSKAESEASQVRSLVSQASRLYPEGVQAIPQLDIAKGSIMSDVIFDDLFSDMAFHEKIKTSQEQVLQVQHNIEAQFANLNQHLASQKQELDTAQARLTHARQQLQDMRSQIFAQVSGQQPPPYQA